MEADAFTLMEQAMALCKENQADNRADTCNHVVTYLTCGDIHVCRGPKCPHVELNADKCYVCTLSGVVYGALSVREDYSTGRQAGSSNPV